MEEMAVVWRELDHPEGGVLEDYFDVQASQSSVSRIHDWFCIDKMAYSPVIVYMVQPIILPLVPYLGAFFASNYDSVGDICIIIYIGCFSLSLLVL